MKVFIAHSGDRSRDLAEELGVFIRRVIQGTEPWLSSDIEKGAVWPLEVRNHLKDARAGVVCLTSDNLNQRWLLFEAGALSLAPAERVWTFLLDVDHTQVERPLSDFQHTRAERDDVLKMVKSIREAVAASGESTTREEDLSDLFDDSWTRLLEPTILALRARAPSSPPAARGLPDLMGDVLELVRQMNHHVDRSLWRQDKTLQMLHHIYRVTVGHEAPSLAALRRMTSEYLAVSEDVNVRLADSGVLTMTGEEPTVVNAPSETQLKRE